MAHARRCRHRPVDRWKGSENLAGAEVAWPARRRLPSVGGLETVGYEDGVVLPIAVRLTHPGASLRLHAEVDYASVGTAIGFALARGPLDIALVFGALGFGMAAPFIGVAITPGLVAYLPRPGSWMVWLQRGLGLALLGRAVWLLSVLALEAGINVSMLAGGMLAALLAALAWRHRFPPGERARRAIGFAAVALAAIVLLVPSLHGQAVPVVAAGSTSATRQWQPFDEASLHRLVSTGKVVLVDVTAAWCLTCKVNELAVVERPPVVDRLRNPDVIRMRADWTRPDPVVSAYLQSFRRYGVPLDVVYGPGAPDGVALPELLTTDAVMNAFRRAVTGDVRNQEANE